MNISARPENIPPVLGTSVLVAFLHLKTLPVAVVDLLRPLYFDIPIICSNLCSDWIAH